MSSPTRRLVVLDPVPAPASPRRPDRDDLDDDHFHDHCGVFGVYGHREAANMTYLGLHALQHRGQESAGIVTSDGDQLYAHRAMGLVQDAFTQEQLAKLPGRAAIGHVRYSTAGASHIKNAQPIAVDYARGSLAVCHNGNLTNADELRAELEERGSIFQSDTDTEVFVHLVAVSKETAVEDRIADALSRVKGAYSLLFLSEQTVVAVRDPMGIRPLCLGVLAGDEGGASIAWATSQGAGAPGPSEPSAASAASSSSGPSGAPAAPGAKSRAYVLASEPCAFDLIGAKYVRDVEPGEMIIIDGKGLRSVRPMGSAPTRSCIFEYVYFARPDSKLGGRSVYEVRRAFGRTLAREHPVEADVIVPVPDSGVPAAIGYAAERGLPFDLGLIRSHYVGRTFIEPQQSIRHFGVRLKLSTVEPVLRGKRVVVIDDSIVRGTTSRKIVKMIRDAGAREVHMRISSPPTQWPCYYGIDTPTRRELIASSHAVDEIARYVTADSLAYLSLEGMLAAVGGEGSFCHACFSGRYEIPFSPTTKRQLRLIGV